MQEPEGEYPAGGGTGRQARQEATRTSLTHTVHLINLILVIFINSSKLAKSILKLAQMGESATIM